MRRHADEALAAIDETLANYYEGVGAKALQFALEAQVIEYKVELAEQLNLGLISEAEVLFTYSRHGWSYPQPIDTKDL